MYITDENYIHISGWMINKLGLKGNALMVYAIIYGFSQDGESEFTGSINYLCEWTNASRPTISKALAELVEKGLIIKTQVERNRVLFNMYKVSLPPVKNLYTPRKESLHNNTNNILNTLDTNVSKVPDTQSPENVPNISEEVKPKGKLLQTTPKTRKSSIQKTNEFISMCEREMLNRQYPVELQNELMKFFRMLGEQNVLLPYTTIKEQLSALDKLNDSQRVEAVRGTVQRAWRSLVYMCNDILKGSSKNKNSFDPAFVGQVQPKPIDAPTVYKKDLIDQAKERGEEIF